MLLVVVETFPFDITHFKWKQGNGGWDGVSIRLMALMLEMLNRGHSYSSVFGVVKRRLPCSSTESMPSHTTKNVVSNSFGVKCSSILDVSHKSKLH